MLYLKGLLLMFTMVVLLLSISVESASIVADHYILHPMDLTDVEAMKSFVSQTFANKEYPLLIPCYLQPPHSDSRGMRSDLHQSRFC